MEFLSSRDDNLRMAALECLEEQTWNKSKSKRNYFRLKENPMNDDN